MIHTWLNFITMCAKTTSKVDKPLLRCTPVRFTKCLNNGCFLVHAMLYYTHLAEWSEMEQNRGSLGKWNGWSVPFNRNLFRVLLYTENIGPPTEKAREAHCTTFTHTYFRHPVRLLNNLQRTCSGLL